MYIHTMRSVRRVEILGETPVGGSSGAYESKRITVDGRNGEKALIALGHGGHTPLNWKVKALHQQLACG